MVVEVSVVNTLTGQQVSRLQLQPAQRVVDIKAQVEDATTIQIDEQVLCLKGRPLHNSEVLVDLLAGSEELSVGLREADYDWVRTLEDATSRGRRFLEDIRNRLHMDMEDSIRDSHDRSASLVKSVASLKQALKVTLTKLTSCGNEMLLATGDLQRNRDIIFDTVPRSSKGTRHAADDLRNCREKVLHSVQENGRTLVRMMSELNPTHKVVFANLGEAASALEQSKEVLCREGELIHLAQAKGWLYSDAAKSLLESYRTLLESIAEDTKAIQVVVDDMRKSKQAFRRAVMINRNAIRHTETSLKQDQDIVFGWAMDHVSEERRGKRDFILACVEANGEALEHAPVELRRDVEIVRMAVQQSDGWALQFVAPELKRDREIVLAAVRRNGWALEYAAEEMKKDEAVVMAAVQANGEALEHAARDLKRNRDIVLTAIMRSNGWALQVAAEDMQRDRDLVLAAVRANGLVYSSIVQELKDDPEVALAAVQANGLVLECMSEDFRNDRKIVEAAVESNPLALKFASVKLRKDYALVLKALQKDGTMFEFASEELRSDRHLALTAIYQSGYSILEFASKEIREDEEIYAAPLKPKCYADWSPRPEDGDSSSIVQL